MPTRRIIAAAVLALGLGACTMDEQQAGEELAMAEDPVAAHLEELGLSNIQDLRTSGDIAEGEATYNSQRVRFLYDRETGALHTWDMQPVLP